MATPVPTTDAERTLADLFEARAPHFTDGPLDAGRTEAFRRFAAAGLPHRRVEAYRYTDLKARLRSLPAPAAPMDPDAVAKALADLPPLVPGATRVVLANGRLVTQPFHAEGVSITSMLAADAAADSVGHLVAGSSDPLTLANVGLFDGGAIITLAGEIAAPIEIVHLSPGDALTMGRVAIFLANGSDATVIERFVLGAGSVSNTLAEIIVEDGAKLSLTRIADGAGETGTNLSTHHIRIGERAHLDHLTVSTGTGLMRAQAFCHVAGDDADANFRAATVAIGKRHADNTLEVRHDALDSRSSEVFRSAVGENGVAIVQGRIIVDPGAQKTDAKMMSNALFLDDTGEVVNKPELEIFADDVQCGHGATSGDLDEDPIFYLRARGIPEAEARRLLVEAFLLEALENLPDGPLADAMAAQLRTAIGVPPEAD
ncbi:MAG: Fe-S cluster assembly protein SufD [Acuticoccus sp.]